jgi:protease I
MSLQGKSALVLAADLFEDTELLYPLLRLKEEQVDVTLASPGGDAVTGKKGHGPLEVDLDVEQASADDYDVLVIPGGFAPDALRRSDAVLDLVRAFDTARKPIAFICHAGWVPISAGIISGRKATSFFAIKDDMVNAGCDWVDEEVVVDGNLISARHPGDLGPWLKATIEALR